MTVPDFMPVLKYGGHRDPKEGACVMEYVSVLAGEQFTDNPACVDGALAAVARDVNDALMDEDRHLLVPLIGRLLGTSGLRDPIFIPGARSRYDARMGEACRVARVSWVDIPSPSEDRDAARAGWRKRGLIKLQCLTEFLDEFDKEFGRTTHHELTEPEKELLLTTVNQGASA